MNDLRIVVERIVRPVRAAERRKLRMRTELLGHLQAALAEERERGGDESAALERARLRLGAPAELTAQLQASVPFPERLLLMNIPLSPGLAALERKTAPCYGIRGPMTLTHIGLPVAAAGLMCGLPSLCLIRSIAVPGRLPPHVTALFLIAVIGLQALLWMSYRFVFTACVPHANRLILLRQAALILLTQTALLLSIALAATDRIPTGHAVAVCTGLAIATLIGAYATARWVAVRRRPYDPWLNLRIAE